MRAGVHDPGAPADRIEREILAGTQRASKDYVFDEGHDPERPADLWFQRSHEGDILFVVFYGQACRWSRCLGCNLPSKSSRRHVDFRRLMAQVDHVFAQPEVLQRAPTISKVIVSNNGSILDEATFSSTALMYLVANLNIHLPRLSVLSLETRVDYVDVAELEFLARALKEGDTPTTLELAVGLETFDDRIRNEVFLKGLKLDHLESLCRMLGKHGFRLKCYLMLKPVPDMTDEQAVEDIHRAIDYLSEQARTHRLEINVHLNPTYVAAGTALEGRFRAGAYSAPRLVDVARAAVHGEGKGISIFLGLSDEGLSCPGGSFIRRGEEGVLAALEEFNRTQEYALLRAAACTPGPGPSAPEFGRS